MTRLELLRILVGQARTNGFEFRRWYTTRLGLPWINADAAFTVLDTQRRYYALLFSHEFASAFWKAGTDITFQVPTQSFDRVMPDGSIGTVTRKSFTRRSSRSDAWRYHLRQMALAEEPLRYMRKYLAVEEDLDETSAPAGPEEESPTSAKTATKAAAKKAAAAHAKAAPAPEKAHPAKRPARPLPTGLPPFLRRPYP